MRDVESGKDGLDELVEGTDRSLEGDRDLGPIGFPRCFSIVVHRYPRRKDYKSCPSRISSGSRWEARTNWTTWGIHRHIGDEATLEQSASNVSQFLSRVPRLPVEPAAWPVANGLPPRDMPSRWHP